MAVMRYSEHMGVEPAHIILRIDTKEPIEIGDFVSAFTSLASQYEKFIKAEYPEYASEADVYVKEVRAGSIIADLFPLLTIAAPFISDMDKILIVDQFIRTYGGRLASFFQIGGRLPDASKSDLKDFNGTVAAIARDPDASAQLEAAYFEDGKKKIKAAFRFTTPQARLALEQIQAQKREIEHQAQADHERVLMRFTRPDINMANLHKRSGERVIIEEVSPRYLALIYASELAEHAINRVELRGICLQWGRCTDYPAEIQA